MSRALSGPRLCRLYRLKTHASSHLGQLPRVAALAVEHRIRRVVADKLFPGRVPLEISPDLNGDVGQVTDRGDAVANLDREVGIFPAFDALQEVIVLTFRVGV